MISKVNLESIFKLFIPHQAIVAVTEINDGLINETFKVQTQTAFYVLQSVNTNVFKQIEAIENNIKLQNIALQKAAYQLLTLHFYESIYGRLHEKVAQKVWRVMDFVPQSRVVPALSAESVFEASSAYSAYLSALNKGNVQDYLVTIPDFKHPMKYYAAFETVKVSVAHKYTDDIKSISDLLIEKKDFLGQYAKILKHLPIRVAHNDAKLTNILFDSKAEKAIAVIDLDTLQVGSVLDDFGDMIRSMTTYTNENETDFDSITINDSLLKSVIEGFLKHLKKDLTPVEIEHLYYAAELTILVQAMRFLTDAFQGNTYYKTDYLGHNLDRTINQMTLWKSFVSKKEIFNTILKQALCN